MLRRAPACMISVLLLSGILPVWAQQRTAVVDLTAMDGIKLKAIYFDSGRPDPAIMLLHMCGDATRTAWDDLGPKLTASGFHVLAPDYRGYGESGGAPHAQEDSAEEKMNESKWPFDIDVALSYLLAQSGVTGNDIGAAGAACGMENSIALAIRHHEVKSLVLLSGGTTTQGLNYIRENPSLAILGAASRDDVAVAPHMRWLGGFSSNPATRFIEFEKAGHGTNMFAAEKGLEPAIVQWFSDTLKQTSAEGTPPRFKATDSPDLEFWSAITAPDGGTHTLEIYRAAKRRHAIAVPFPVNAMIFLGDERLESVNLWMRFSFSNSA